MSTKPPQNKPQQVIVSTKGIAVGKNWMVGADAENIILYQRQHNTKTDTDYWRPHSYYATVAHALEGLINQEVRDTALVDIKTVCERLEQLRKDIIAYSAVGEDNSKGGYQ